MKEIKQTNSLELRGFKTGASQHTNQSSTQQSLCLGGNDDAHAQKELDLCSLEVAVPASTLSQFMKSAEGASDEVSSRGSVSIEFVLTARIRPQYRTESYQGRLW